MVSLMLSLSSRENTAHQRITITQDRKGNVPLMRNREKTSMESTEGRAGFQMTISRNVFGGYGT